MSVIGILKATAASSNVLFTLVMLFCLALLTLVVGLVAVVVGGQVEYACEMPAARINPFPTLQVLEIFANLKDEYNPAALERALGILGDHKVIVLGPEVQRIEVPMGIYSLLFVLLGVYFAALFVASTWAMSKLSGGNGGKGGGSSGGKGKDGKKESGGGEGGTVEGGGEEGKSNSGEEGGREGEM